jgi:hypothetical protein
VDHKDARTRLEATTRLVATTSSFKRSQSLLDDAEVIAVLDEDLVDQLPTGAVEGGAVDQYNVLHRRGVHRACDRAETAPPSAHVTTSRRLILRILELAAPRSLWI